MRRTLVLLAVALLVLSGCATRSVYFVDSRIGTPDAKTAGGTPVKQITPAEADAVASGKAPPAASAAEEKPAPKPQAASTPTPAPAPETAKAPPGKCPWINGRYYCSRDDLEAGMGPGPSAPAAPGYAYQRYYPVGCRPPYVPKFGGGCELPMGYGVPGYGGSSYFFYYRRR